MVYDPKLPRNFYGSIMENYYTLLFDGVAGSASILLLYRWPHRTPKWPPGLSERPRLPELPSEYIYKNPETIRTVLLSMMFSCSKVEKLLKGSLDSIPSPSPLHSENSSYWWESLLKIKSLLTTPSNVLPLHLKQTFPHIIWIFTEGEGDGIESILPVKIFTTLPMY